MKLHFGKRLLTGLAGLLILIIGIYLLIVATGLFTPKVDFVAFASSLELLQRILLIVGAVLLCVLGIVELGVLFHRRRDKGFVMQHTEHGDVSISMNALDSMVCKCVEQHKELCVKSTSIDRAKDGIEIEIRILLEAGVNIPLTVNALQKQIKQYITSCSGVDVITVKVLVETDASKDTPKLMASHASEPIRFAEAPVQEAKQSEPEAETPAAQPQAEPVSQAKAESAETHENAEVDAQADVQPESAVFEETEAVETAADVNSALETEAEQELLQDEPESSEPIHQDDIHDDGNAVEPSDAIEQESDQQEDAMQADASETDEWNHKEEQA